MLKEEPKWRPQYNFLIDALRDLRDRKAAGDPKLENWSLAGDIDIEAWFAVKREYPVVANQAESAYYKSRVGEPRFVQFDRSITRRKTTLNKEQKANRDELRDGLRGKAMEFDAAAMDVLPQHVEDFGKDGELVHGEALEWADTSSRSLRQDVDFAAEYAMRADMTAEKCPSGRSWFMVLYARQYPKEFASTMLSKYIPTASKVASEEEARLENTTYETMLSEMFTAAAESDDLDNEVAARDDFAPQFDEIVP